MKLKQIKEGKVKIFTPAGNKYEGEVFYNEDAEFTRDISVSATQVFQNSFKDKLRICDALSATGIRGLRYAKEVKGVGKVILNDSNPFAVKIIKKNIALNKLGKKCTANRCDAALWLRQNIYSMIDLDPFGPPVKFLDSAGRSIYHKGFFAVSATDTAALCGSSPEAGFRKYGIKPIKTEFYSELGLRILISSIILALAKYDRAFIPVLSFSYKHYYRTFGRIEHAEHISKLLDEFGFVNYCPTCGERMFGRPEVSHEFRGEKHLFETCGPIYLGKINDQKFVEDVVDDIDLRKFKLKPEELRLLRMLRNESDLAIFYYDLHHLSKLHKFQIPKYDRLMRDLIKNGFRVSRTSFSNNAIKTEAKLKDLLKILI